MKNLIGGCLSVLLLATGSTAMAIPINYDNISSSPQQVALQVNVPHITSSGVINNSHFIRVAVVGMSLENINIYLPSQMERFNGIKIKDKSGRDIAAKTEVTKERLSITFDQPITPGNSLEVQFTNVQARTSISRILLYGVTAKRVGLRGEIPIGTARVDLPDKS
ncbi:MULTISPECIES: DUF2808 domain-containing protein [unclassified Anabaena]|uniref:DUF2808 domain-containing protein n=1 Tax=unclassified Anabaena TaxID=2619674 RepID=UPI002B1FE663|nr:DUF2808 domain-containing protein [Anabaena sp. UHCC 0399]MEA5566727.1 DUF2808 domain-containing protein [Anabaena sp. UHCC 0399]